jgi:hypothetical protein
MARLNIAFYLPQFHPISENDEWWEPGFTEWTNVTKARPLFPGHYQPILPRELGFYDLRLNAVRQKQVALAKDYGVTGFCYWHYWFAGKRLLETPLNMLLDDKEVDFPFCVAWANASWTGIWYGAPNKVLMEQTYPDDMDIIEHLKELRRFFDDVRYIRINGSPLLVIFRPIDIPDLDNYIAKIRYHASALGIGSLFVVGIYGDGAFVPDHNPFDGITVFNLHKVRDERGGNIRNTVHNFLTRTPFVRKVRRLTSPIPDGMYYYRDASQHFVGNPGKATPYFPCVIPNFDNTARSGRGAFILHQSDPELFREVCKLAAKHIGLPGQPNITFIKSWNEWAEGNILEPDRHFGREYLKVVASELG